MQAILEFFGGLADILGSLIMLVVNLVSSIVWLVTNLPQLVGGITSALAFIPTYFMPYALVCLALITVFAIIKIL